MPAERAAAKINLFLHVGDKRADGFHPLQSLAVFADLGDLLNLAPAAGLSLALDGPFSKELEKDDDNLVVRAAHALKPDLRDEGAAIALTKNLPVASGIGGGSADAAAALRGLSRLWNLPQAEDKLCAIAAGLGSDVPACIGSRPVFMEGRGEILKPVTSLPRLAMLLVNPGVAVPTKDVFAGLSKRSGIGMTLSQGRFRDTADLLRFLETTANDLEAPARALQPVIGEVLAAIAALPGALFTRMSGSGATCFGLFADDGCSARAADLLRAAHPQWWIAPTFAPETGIVHEGVGQDIGPTEDGL
jgi:4-diphosphocytidyl-2-C-methyl-D-erythritol kinase